MKSRFTLPLFFLACLLVSGLATAAETVNINKADAAALTQNLEGIGVVKAEAIVSYRKKNGSFKSIDDLKKVEGIGPKLIKNNKRYLSTSKGVSKGDAAKYAAAKKTARSNGKKSSSKKKKTKSTQTAAKKSTTKPAKKPKKNKKSKPSS